MEWLNLKSKMCEKDVEYLDKRFKFKDLDSARECLGLMVDTLKDVEKTIEFLEGK